MADLVTKVSENWRPAFERFVETGEAESDFLDYLNSDKPAQEAVETAFNRQASRFEGLAAELRQPESVAQASEAKLAAPARVAAAVQAALDAPSRKREQVLESSTADIAASMPAEELVVLKEFARSLEDSLAKVAELPRS